MAYRKKLIELSYHYDDDTGLYKVGEIDFGVSGELDNYIKQYGRKGINDILIIMSHLIWHIQEYGYKTIKEQTKTETDNEQTTKNN